VSTFGPYRARVVEVHDGDTILVDLDLGFGHVIVARDWDGKPWLACRVFGINAPELSTVAGKDARTFAQSLLPTGSRVQVVSHGWDKYGGRFDGEIDMPHFGDFAAAMLGAGHAVPFKGLHVKE
jgi:endonuclease YncB( thermonuclease family)